MVNYAVLIWGISMRSVAIVALIGTVFLWAPNAYAMPIPSHPTTVPAAVAYAGGSEDPMLAHKGGMVKAGVTMIIITSIVAVIQLTDDRESNDTSGYLYLTLALAGTAGVIMGAE